MNEAETKFHLIDPILRAKGYDDHQRLRLETPAPVEAIGHKGQRSRRAGRVDYLLCVLVGDLPKPLPVGILEAAARLKAQLAEVDKARQAAELQLREINILPQKLLAQAFGSAQP